MASLTIKQIFYNDESEQHVLPFLYKLCCDNHMDAHDYFDNEE